MVVMRLLFTQRLKVKSTTGCGNQDDQAGIDQERRRHGAQGHGLGSSIL